MFLRSMKVSSTFLRLSAGFVALALWHEALTWASWTSTPTSVRVAIGCWSSPNSTERRRPTPSRFASLPGVVGSLVGVGLGVSVRLRRTRRYGKPDFDGELSEQTWNELKDKEIMSAEIVTIPTQGCASHVSTVYHKGVRVKSADGKSIIIDRMDDGKLYKRPDSDQWVTERPIEVDKGVHFKVLMEGEKDGYNLLSNNCVHQADRLAKEMSEKERQRQADELSSSVAAGGAMSALDDVTDGKIPDGKKAAIQSFGAGVSTFTNQQVQKVSGSQFAGCTIAGAFGSGLTAKLNGASDEKAKEAALQVGGAAAQKELARHAAQQATKCPGVGAVAAEMALDAGLYSMISSRTNLRGHVCEPRLAQCRRFVVLVLQVRVQLGGLHQ